MAYRPQTPHMISQQITCAVVKPLKMTVRIGDTQWVNISDQVKKNANKQHSGADYQGVERC